MKLRKIIALLLCAMTVMGLAAGCGNNDTPATNDTPANNNTPSTNTPATNTPATNETPAPAVTTYQEKIVIGTHTEFTTIDPQNTSATMDQVIQNSVFDGLTGSDPETGNVVGALAETVTMIAPDLWEFKLRENVNFHDGTVMNADDVVFTFERAKDSSFCTSTMSQIAEIIKVDDMTVQMKLNAGNTDFNYNAGSENLAILSKEAFETMSEEQAAAIGTGPFKFVEYTPGQTMTLTRFEEGTYHEIPNTKELVFKFLPEASARVIALQTGEIDICMSPSSIDIPSITEDSKLQLLQIPTRGVRHIAFNCEGDSPLADPLVRKALSCAVNREEIIIVAEGGYAEASNNLMSSGCWGYAEIDGIPEDIAKAKEYLAQAGYPNGFETSITFSNSTVNTNIATVFQAQMAEIGVKVELEPLESATLRSVVYENAEHDMHISRWSPGRLPDGMFRGTLMSTAANNNANLHDTKFDSMMDAALAETDTAKRLEMYKEIQTYVTEEVIAWIPLYQSLTSMATKAGVEGIILNEADCHNFSYAQLAQN